MKTPGIAKGKKLQIEKANSAMFIAVVVGSIIVSFSLILINFLWNLRSFNAKVIEGKTEARNTLEQNIENVDSLEIAFKTLEESDQVNSKLVLDALPSTFDFPALATSVESIALKSGVLLDGFAGEDQSQEELQVNPSSLPVEIPFTMQVTGSYPSIQDFLNNLEKSIRPIKVLSIELSGTDSNLQASLDLVTYYQPGVTLDVQTETVE